MRFKTILATGLAAALAASSLVTTAEARHRHHHGFPLAAGAFGFAAGALIGSALAPRYPYYYYDNDYPSAYYYDRGSYYGRDYYDEPPVYYRSAPRYDRPRYDHPCNTPAGTSKPAWAMC